MFNTELSANRAVVFASALVYWAGVYIQARRIRRRIGHSPNVKPRGTRETLLWVGWFLVVVAWLSLPFVAATDAYWRWLRIIPSLCSLASFLIGALLMVAGYAGTLWCYAAMGSTWRMGVNRAEKTSLVKHGPYRYVRHPIYVFQVVMLVGMVVLLPAPVSLVVLVVHMVCILAKATDEESYLRTMHGKEYGDYLSRSGRFLPKLRSIFRL